MGVCCSSPKTQPTKVNKEEKENNVIKTDIEDQKQTTKKTKYKPHL